MMAPVHWLKPVSWLLPRDARRAHASAGRCGGEWAGYKWVAIARAGLSNHARVSAVTTIGNRASRSAPLHRVRIEAVVEPLHLRGADATLGIPAIARTIVTAGLPGAFRPDRVDARHSLLFRRRDGRT